MKESGLKKSVSLSGRLQMLANMVTKGSRLVDVGCDHGFLPIYLVSTGICPKALAMDVREGPLDAARTHIEEFGLGDYIEIRLSDGLEKFDAGEGDSLVCAGMGGRLMERILTEGRDKLWGMKELILQPQSELEEFRIFLKRNGFRIIREDAVLEDGKYYFAMKAVPARRESGDREAYYGSSGTEAGDFAESKETAGRCRLLYDRYGERLLHGRHPVLRQYLLQRQACLEHLEVSLLSAGSQKAKTRLEEVRDELTQIKAALDFFTGEITDA